MNCGRMMKKIKETKEDEIIEEYVKSVKADLETYLTELVSDFVDNCSIDEHDISSSIDDFLEYIEDCGDFKPDVELDEFASNYAESICDDYGDQKYEESREARWE
jgi:hypothetical protein